VIVEWEVTIAIGITTARSNVRRVDDISVEKVDVVHNVLVELLVTFLNVFAPEVLAFEQLGTAWDFAAVFIGVFFLDELERMKSQYFAYRRPDKGEKGLPCRAPLGCPLRAGHRRAS
jgi:hypothetical protein